MKNRIIIFAVVALALAACSKEDSYLAELNNQVEISTRITPMSEANLTRASIGQDGRGSFEEGDQISLFVAGNQHTLTLKSNAWTPQLLWEDLKADRATFTGYYPTVANAQEFKHSVALDQRTEREAQKSDLLMATTSVNKGERVGLNFHHAMTLVEFNLKSENAYSAQDLASAVLKIKAHSSIKVSAQEARLNAVDGEEQVITFRNMGGGKYHAVVCPQPMKSAWRNTAWIEILIGGKTLTYKAPAALDQGVDFSALESGKKLTFNLTINQKNEVENDWANKTVWVYGIQNPPMEEWGLAFSVPYKVPGLEWKREYGWFDCNKIDPVSSSADDSNLCWAATVSNMLYWWLAQNKENIERYGYTGPNTYNSSTDCDVFKYFKDHFLDKGSFMHSALNWFLWGKPVKNESNHSFGNHKGFFNDLFNDNVVRITSANLLSEDFKMAFTNKESIGMAIMVKAGSSSHAITVWGADFDANGEVCTVYIVENNDVDIANQGISPMQPGKLCPTGLYPKKIKKIGNGYYMESSTPDSYTHLIHELDFLSTKDQEWANYFATHNK